VPTTTPPAIPPTTEPSLVELPAVPVFSHHRH
jgi:hypothetical protein